MRDYTLVLTIQVRAEEDKNEIDHDWLREELQAMFPTNQEKTIGRIIKAEVIDRNLTRNY